MSTLWKRGEAQVGLNFGNLFEVAYPQNHLPHVTDWQKIQMTQAEVDHVATNLFEHPTLDLRSIFQVFRLSGLSSNDSSHIQSFLEECQNDIKALDTTIKDTISKIAQLSRDLTEASARMVQKVSQVGLCEYLLSSPTHLPQDIIEQIFLACLTAGDDPAQDQQSVPLQLAAVCHRWRTIALSLPALWNGLSIDSIGDIELAKIWARRCYLPSLTLDLDSIDPDVTAPAKLKELFAVLQGHSVLLRKINIKWGGALDGMTEKFIMEGNHPALEELVLRGEDWVLPSLPECSTSLRRIYSHLPPIAWHHSPPPSQLTVLWLTSTIHWNTLVVFLANCPNLESLYVHLDEEGLQLDPEPLVSQDIVLHQLSYFGLWDDCDETQPPDALLQGVTFPSLRIMEYCVCERLEGESTLWLGFIHALKPVRRLTLQFHEKLPSLDTFTRVLEHATSVTELSISTYADFMSDVLTWLASIISRRMNESIVLPSLQTLYLDLSSDDLTNWLSLQTKLIEFNDAWATSLSFGPKTPYSPPELVIQHKYTANDKEEAWRRRSCEVKQMLQSACPNLCVRIVGVENISWLGEEPEAFVMSPLPFNDMNVHEVLEDDGSWTTQLYAVYRVM
ncbi:hypothetical protein BDN72DRAFT_881488 [Pluteus cervinus]|uniref:Uncharacterized protein n=1 Tax=Pluteus cervinus TaxID=181527 RepID=A0ACD3AFM2_9AGAR|nr:hypothetical protein BDN72DRAFT_881488 [Pluteus cervinus]